VFTILLDCSSISCQNEDKDIMVDLFILDHSIEYPLNSSTMVYQQHWLEKRKVNDTSAYQQFIFLIILTNGQTLDMKMSLCALRQVTSSGLRHPLKTRIDRNICSKQSRIRKVDKNSRKINTRKGKTYKNISVFQYQTMSLVFRNDI
jgi:hypothetical protein